MVACGEPRFSPRLIVASNIENVVKVLVTGASGFIGSAIVHRLIERGHSVIGLSRNPPLGRHGVTNPELSWIKGNLDVGAISELENLKLDACVHAAWIATPGEYLESPENDILVSRSSQFLKQLQDIGVRKMVVLGTCIEYDLSTRKPLSEDTTLLRPDSTYARSKNSLHNLLQKELDASTSLCWARVFFPYGRGEDSRRLSSWLIQRFANGEIAELKTPENRNDYIHITDVASALSLALEKNFRGAINIGTGKGVTVHELALEIANQMECPKLVKISKSDNLNTAVEIVASIDRLRSLGWSPVMSLEKGIGNLIESIYKSRNSCN